MSGELGRVWGVPVCGELGRVWGYACVWKVWEGMGVCLCLGGLGRHGGVLVSVEGMGYACVCVWGAGGRNGGVPVPGPSNAQKFASSKIGRPESLQLAMRGQARTQMN